jgi:hypothetical protein
MVAEEMTPPAETNGNGIPVTGNIPKFTGMHKYLQKVCQKKAGNVGSGGRIHRIFHITC